MSRLLKKMRGILRYIYKTWTLKILYPTKYRRYARAPVKKNKIIFLEVRENHLTDNFQLLWQELERRGGYDCRLICIGEGMMSRRQIEKNCLAAIPDFGDAAAVFVNDSSYFLSSLPLRPETKVIQTWHGCGAFKAWGYSVADKKFGADKKDLERFPVHRNFTYVTVSSQEVCWAYADSFHMEDRLDAILPIGVSRSDVFFQENCIAKAYERLYQAVPQAKGKKIVLYGPTFRGQASQAYSPEVLDFSACHKQLGEEYFFLCKHHPFVRKRPKLPKDSAQYVFDATEVLSIEDILMVSDICITDYSGLIAEYSLFERPMIFLAYDLEEFCDWRSFYYPFEEMMPGPIVKTTEEVIAYIRALPESFDRQRVVDFKRKFMSACDGHSTERILKLLE